MPVRRSSQVLARWGGMGPGLTVVTLGAHGVTYRVSGSGEEAHLPAEAETVIDTVGAGDSFMAGLISGLLDTRLLGGAAEREHLSRATLAEITPAIRRAMAASAVTVSRAGAYAPTRAEIGA